MLGGVEIIGGLNFTMPPVPQSLSNTADVAVDRRLRGGAAASAQADAAGLNVLRLGRSYRVGPAAAHLTLSARIDASPQAPALRRLEVEISRADWRERRSLSRVRSRTSWLSEPMLVPSPQLAKAPAKACKLG